MSTNCSDFLPSLIAIERTAPHPASLSTLWLLLTLLAALLLWIGLGTLDIVAVADGKLVPSSYVKIIQPAEGGIVREILVQEGQAVQAGQTLMRMDAVVNEADRQAVFSEYQNKRVALRRIDAQLTDRAFTSVPDEPAQLFAQASAQYNANRNAYSNQLDLERSALDKARSELAAAEQVKAKLEQVLPHYRKQQAAYEQLGKDGFVGQLIVADKARERIEREQDLNAQLETTRAARAVIAGAEQRIKQVTADYRRQLQTERADIAAQYERLSQELAKQDHRRDLLELRAPQAGFVKDLATHTAGTVVQPGTILMSLVPANETLTAEVWVSNEDVGFVHEGQRTMIKLAAYPFQKYGMIQGKVIQVSADAQDPATAQHSQAEPRDSERQGLRYRALVELDMQQLVVDDKPLSLTPGMQVSAEVSLGRRTVVEYLLSPVMKAFVEAGRER